jgi:protein required for attachment to host cells
MGAYALEVATHVDRRQCVAQIAGGMMAPEAEDRFAAEIAAALYRRSHTNHFHRLIVVAPPKVLGALRQEFR